MLGSMWKWNKVKVKSLSHVRLFATPWTVAHQAPPSMGFSRQEYWSGLPFPSPGDVPNPGIEPRSPALQADTLTSEPSGKPVKLVILTTKWESSGEAIHYWEQDLCFSHPSWCWEQCSACSMLYCVSIRLKGAEAMFHQFLACCRIQEGQHMFIHWVQKYEPWAHYARCQEYSRNEQTHLLPSGSLQPNHLDISIFTYIYLYFPIIYICVHIYIYIYLYLYKEKQQELLKKCSELSIMPLIF